MKTSIVITLLILFGYSGFGQFDKDEPIDPKRRYNYEGVFEGVLFYDRSQKSVYETDEDGRRCGVFSSEFRPDSTYSISIEAKMISDGQVGVNEYFSFHGRYIVDDNWAVTLEGGHPFDSNVIIVKTSKVEDWGCFYFRGYTFKFSERFNWISRRKVHLYCDGGCYSCPEDYE